MTIKDKTRSRKTYSFYRAPPVLETTVAAAVTNNCAGGSDVLKFDSIAELAAFDVGAAYDKGCVYPGVLAYVTSVQDYFSLGVPTDEVGSAPLHTLYVTATNPITNGTFWMRMMMNQTWWFHHTWYVDANNGYDENVGDTCNTALRTIDELLLRLNSIRNGLTDDYTVHVTCDTTSSVQNALGINVKLDGGSINFKGYAAVSMEGGLAVSQHPWIATYNHGTASSGGLTGSVGYWYNATAYNPNVVLQIPLVSSSLDPTTVMSYPYYAPIAIHTTDPTIEGASPEFFGWYLGYAPNKPTNQMGLEASYAWFTTPYPPDADVNQTYGAGHGHMIVDQNPSVYRHSGINPGAWEISSMDYAHLSTRHIKVDGWGACTFTHLMIARYTNQYVGEGGWNPFPFSVLGSPEVTLSFNKCYVFNHYGPIDLYSGPIHFNACRVAGYPSYHREEDLYDLSRQYGFDPGTDKYPLVNLYGARVGFCLSGFTTSGLMQFYGTPSQKVIYMNDSIMEIDDSSLIDTSFALENSRLTLGAKTNGGRPRSTYWRKTENDNCEDTGAPAAVTGCLFSLDGNSTVDVGSLVDGTLALDGATTLMQEYIDYGGWGYWLTVREARNPTTFEIRGPDCTIFTPWRGPSTLTGSYTGSLAPMPTGSYVHPYINDPAVILSWSSGTSYQDSLTNTRVIPGQLQWLILTGSGMSTTIIN